MTIRAHKGDLPDLSNYQVEAVAIDTEIYQDWFVEPIGPDSEVRFLPAIEGG